jgi:hypothetical protein
MRGKTKNPMEAEDLGLTWHKRELRRSDSASELRYRMEEAS